MSLSTFKRPFIAALALLCLVMGSALPAAPAFASDLAVTAANVLQGTSAFTETGTAGEAITAGQLLYKKAADSKWYKADCNSGTAEVRVAKAFALTGAAAAQPIVVQKSGQITPGATMTAGTVYYLSGTAGGIRPAADNTTGDYPQVVGMALSTTVLQIDFNLAASAAL